MYRQEADGKWVKLGTAVSLQDAKELLELCGWLDKGLALYIFVGDEIVSTFCPGSIDCEECWNDHQYRPTNGPAEE